MRPDAQAVPAAARAQARGQQYVALEREMRRSQRSGAGQSVRRASAPPRTFEPPRASHHHAPRDLPRNLILRRRGQMLNVLDRACANAPDSLVGPPYPPRRVAYGSADHKNQRLGSSAATPPPPASSESAAPLARTPSLPYSERRDGSHTALLRGLLARRRPGARQLRAAARPGRLRPDTVAPLAEKSGRAPRAEEYLARAASCRTRHASRRARSRARSRQLVRA